jgi:hypothetical protein
MGYNITNLDSALKNYVDGNKAELVSKAIFSAKSTGFMSLQTGVKATTPIVVMDDNVVFQDGSNCGFNASGDTTFTDRMLEPAFVKINKAWCDKTFLKTYANNEVRVGAGKEQMPFEELITSNPIKKIGKELEKLLWQGDKTNGTGNMALLDGILTLMNADITSTAIPAANVQAKSTDKVYERAIKLWNALPADIADDSAVIMGTDNFRSMVSEILVANNYHLVVNYEKGKYEMTIPYTNITVYGITGLDNTDVIIATPWENIFYGVDAEDDAETFDLWYSKDDKLFKFDCEFAASVNYAVPEYIYVNK